MQHVKMKQVKTRKPALILLFCLLVFSLKSFPQQEYNTYLPENLNDSLRPKSFSASLANNNFLKNNEYFGSFTEGFTYIGSILQPEITYAFTGNASLTAGWFVKYYYGLEKINRSIPVIRFNYQFMPGCRVIFGQLSGQLNHKLIEPIYSFDNYFVRNPEYGLQLLVDKHIINADVWLSWEHFLMPGDPEQEQIAGGINLTCNFLNRNLFFAAAKFQSTIYHFGGQVDISDLPMSTRTNLAPGLELGYEPKNRMINRIKLSGWWVQALDLSPTPMLRYSKGYGIYTQAAAENRFATLIAAWWHANSYFSPLADHLFQSVSEVNPGYTEKLRDLLNVKLLLSQNIAPGVKAGLKFESYYDLRNNRMDFSYGANILAQANWGHKKAR